VTPIDLKLPDVSVVNVVIAVFPNSRVYVVDGNSGLDDDAVSPAATVTVMKTGFVAEYGAES